MNYAKTITVAVGLFGLFLLAPMSAAAEQGSVGGKPAYPRPDNPRTQSIFVHEITPGEEKTDAVVVSNNTSQPQQIELYATDAQIASGGAFACEQKADKSDQEGSWIKLDKNTVSLEGNTSETVSFTITVPKTASVGEHNACIAIQAVAREESQGSTNGVRLSFRSAIRVAITVPGDLKKQLSFESLKVDRSVRGEVAVHETLRNGGNVSLDTNLETAMRTIFGNKIAEDGGEFPVLSGQIAEFNFTFKRPLWGGWYRITANAAYDSSNQTSLGEKSNTRETIGKSTWIFVAPHAAILSLYVGILAAIIMTILWRRRRHVQEAAFRARSITHTVAKAEDLTSISTHYGADWKKTAKLNNLKAPYSLEVGREILIVPSADYVPVKPKSAKKAPTKKKTSKKASPKKPAKTNSSAKKP